MNEKIQKFRKDAQVCAAKGDLGGALAAYQHALKLAPNDARLWVNVADICNKLGQKKEAIQTYEKAAGLYAAQDDVKQAISITQAILNIHPGNKKGQKQLRILQSRLNILKSEAGGDTVAQWYHDQQQQNVDSGYGVQMSEAESMVHDDSVIEFDGGVSGDSAASENIFEFADRVQEQPADDNESQAQAKIRALAPRLAKIPLLTDIPIEDLIALGENVHLHTFDPGDPIAEEGAQDRSVYIVIEGSASVSKKDPNGLPVGLTVLQNGNFFGEFAYLTGKPRTATVTAFDECHVLEISKSGLERLTSQHPRLQQILENFYRRRLMDLAVAISPIFRTLPDEAREKIVSAMDGGVIPPGTILCEQDQVSNALFIVMSGCIEVTIQTNDGIVRHNELNQGESFGEISFITKEPLPASYATAVESRILKLKPEYFLQLLEKYPTVKESVTSVVQKRLRDYASATGSN